MSFGQLPRRPFLKYQKEDEQLDQALAKEEEKDLELRKGPSATDRAETGAGHVMYGPVHTMHWMATYMYVLIILYCIKTLCVC